MKICNHGGDTGCRAPAGDSGYCPSHRATCVARDRVAAVWRGVGLTHPDDDPHSIVTVRDDTLVRLFTDEAAATFSVWVEDAWPLIWETVEQVDEEDVSPDEAIALPLSLTGLLDLAVDA